MPKGAAAPKVRGPYSAQACTICRTKKSKCDGVKPVCGSCEASGRANECVWGRPSASRKPRTEAHFEALRRRADLLQGYVERLEATLAKCVCQDVTAHLQFRPDHLGEYGEREDSDKEGLVDSDDEIAQELYVPMQSLKLDDRSGGLLLHAITPPNKFDQIEAPHQPEARQLADASYILCVDGMDMAHCHPDIEWQRYLPPEVSLDRREHDKILSISFKFFTMWCLRVMPALFLRDMYRALSVPRSQPPPRTPHYSPMLHNAILSISAVFSDDPYIREPQTRKIFAKAAKAWLETDCEKPGISLVPALAFLGSYHADAGDRILSDLFFGMSTKVSIDLGLAVDCTVWVKAGLISPDEARSRIWIHWTIFAMDVAWALFFGRDFLGPPADSRTIPIPSVDSELDQLPWHHAPANIPPQANYLTLVFRETASLFAIGRKVIDIQNNLATARQDLRKVDEDITNIDLELHNWKSRLPDHLDITLANRARSTPQRLMLHCQYYWTFIVLHRPFFNRRSIPTQVHLDGKIDHVKLCLRAAENILEILETWSSVYTLGFSPMPLAQIMFSAGTVFLLRALQSTASPRIAHGALNTALAQVEQCIHYLREMGHRFRSATRIALNLHALLNDKLRPIVARRIAQKGIPMMSGPPPPPSSSSSVSTPESSSYSYPSPPSDGEKLTTELTSAYTPAYDSSHLLPNSIPVYPMDWSSNSPHASPPPPQAWAQQNQTPTAWDYIPQHGENTSPEQSAMYQPGGEDAYPALDPDMSAFMGLPGFDRVWAQDSLPNPRPPFGFPPPPGQYLSHR